MARTRCHWALGVQWAMANSWSPPFAAKLTRDRGGETALEAKLASTED
jgi:hypothetical protein